MIDNNTARVTYQLCTVAHPSGTQARFTGRSFGLDDNGRELQECEQPDGSKCIHPLVRNQPGYLLTGCIE